MASLKTNTYKLINGGKVMLRSILSFFVVLAFSTIVFAQGMSGTAHDFRGEPWYGGNEICQVCHAPHNNQNVTGDVLWNHDPTVGPWTAYSSGSLNATVGDPAFSSKLCLSCHDGTIALDSWGGNTGSIFITGAVNLTTDLSNDHPVSFTYDPALATADGGLFDPTVTLSGITPAGTIDDDMLIAGEMECASCHDMHNQLGVGGLLKKDNIASDLCLTCHDK